MTESKLAGANPKHKLFWWSMFIVVILLLVLLLCGVVVYPLFHTKSIVLMASLGETTMVEIPAGRLYVQNTAWYDSKEVPITGDPINPEDYSVHQYRCENGKIIGNRTERRSTSLRFQAYLTNNCDVEVKIEIWWFDNFELLN